MTREEMKKRDSEKIMRPVYQGMGVTEKRPFFAMATGIYAVQTHGDKPTNFLRLDKKRTLPGRQRKKAAREARRLVKTATKFKEAANGK